MKKPITLLFSTIFTVGGISIAPIVTSCSKNSNLTFDVDSHVKGYKCSSWQVYNDFTIECDLEDGYQISTAKFVTTSRKQEIDQKYVTITKNKIVLDQQPILDNAKVTITIKTSKVASIPVIVNNNKFNVEQTSFNWKTDTDLVIKPTSGKYENNEVHDMSTVHGEFLLYRNGSIIQTIQFESSETKQYKLVINDFIRLLAEGKFEKVVVNLKFAKIALEKPWEVFASIAGKSNGLEIAQATFNPGDYAMISLPTTDRGWHYVRITDMGVDDLASGSGKATFTFEFVNPIADRSSIVASHISVSAWSSSINNDYSNSTVQAKITSTASDGLKKLLLEALGTSASSLKTIKRNYLKTNETHLSVNYFNTTFNTEIFLPGLKNIMSDTGISNWTKFDVDDRNVFKLENNTQYKFYQNEIGDLDYLTVIQQNKFVRKYDTYSEKEYHSTWIATPDVSNVYNAMVFNSKSPSDKCKWNMIGHAPCFCF